MKCKRCGEGLAPDDGFLCRRCVDVITALPDTACKMECVIWGLMFFYSNNVYGLAVQVNFIYAGIRMGYVDKVHKDILHQLGWRYDRNTQSWFIPAES